MPDVDAFVARWSASGGSERSNSQPFLHELCELLDVPRPEPFASGGDNAYVFERPVQFSNGDGSFSDGRIDLFKRGCFVLESKQGVLRREAERGTGRVRTGAAVRETPGWDQAMTRACVQAQRYIHALPADEGRPPFVLTCDVGHSFEIYAEFSRTGGDYTPFPAAPAHRLFLPDLARPEARDLLRTIWLDPLSLDPSRRTARVTREIADRLARLATSLEAAGQLPETVAAFLMRALFTMFAEDVGLLPGRSFTDLLDSLRATPDAFKPMAEEVWRAMKHGGFSAALRAPLRHFNGALFAEAEALDLSADQLGLLLEASRADWREVEPAIFGTLLERALSPRERHKLGAHYTPRAYVERLVIPTVVEPLRADWEAARIAARKLDSDGETAKAIAELRAFHSRLCQVRVLDPACGSGNFLYVTLEHLKRLEGEVLDALRGLGYAQEGLEHAEGTVGPRQLLGLEINPRAAAIAELVLWIGYLQWHLKTRGLGHTPEPVIGDFHNVQCRDAVLAYDGVPQMVLGEGGRPVMRWDGHSTKPHAVTGEPVPDETKTLPVYRYANPRPAEWPEAEFVVGNPPFIGISRMRQALGDG